MATRNATAIPVLAIALGIGIAILANAFRALTVGLGCLLRTPKALFQAHNPPGFALLASTDGRFWPSSSDLEFWSCAP
jgi:hypothetical protein